MKNKKVRGHFFVYSLILTELPCTAYKTLNTADRSVDFYDPDVRKCDTELTPGWYRFIQPAGFAGMAPQCPDKFACGTYGPGWLKGSHPAVNEGNL